jgi:hypothetical protein
MSFLPVIFSEKRKADSTITIAGAVYKRTAATARDVRVIVVK